MAYDRIEPISPEPFDRISKIQRVQRRRRDEEEDDREERRREERESQPPPRAESDDDGHPHIDVQA